MSDSVKKLTLSAMFTAVGAALIFVSALLPTGRIAIVAVAGILTAAAVIHCGILQGIEVYVATAILALLIVSEKSSALLYIVFLGYYPVTKSLIEKKITNKWLCFLSKLLLINVVLTLLGFFAQWILLNSLGFDSLAWGFIQVALNVVFIIYDLALTKLITMYIYRISKRVK